MISIALTDLSRCLLLSSHYSPFVLSTHTRLYNFRVGHVLTSGTPYTVYVKNFAKPSYLYIAEIFGGINFHQCGIDYRATYVYVSSSIIYECSKGRYILYAIVNTGQNIRVRDWQPLYIRWRNWRKLPHI